MAYRILAALIGTSIAAVPLPSAEVQAHRVRMVATQVLENQIEDALMARSSRAAARAAKSLVPILADEEKYWDRTHLDDALMYAQRNLAAARSLAASTRRGNLSQASSELDSMRGNCVACHGRHPENRVVVGR
ncbi:MAG: hypothetical protein ABIO39_04495 [Caulobacteraceae bacterium]